MKLTNIFYPKNIISLFYCLIIVKQKKGYNILILNKNYISHDLIKNYFSKIHKFFQSVYFFNFQRLSSFKYKSFLNELSQSNKNLDKIKNIKLINKLLQINGFINFYGSNDGIETYLHLNKKHKIKFHFLEHGHGNLLHFYLNQNSFKDILKNFIIKTLYCLGLTNSYPIKFESYNGVLAKNLSRLRINGTIVRNINCLSNLEKNLFKYSNKIQGNIKNPVWINLSDKNLRYDPNRFNRILNFIKQDHNPKKEILFIKLHPNDKYNFDIHLKKLLEFLNKNKIRFKIEKSKRSKLPMELFFLNFNIKKSYSFLNTTTLINANFKFKFKFKNYVFLDYTLKNSNINKFSTSIKDFYKKNFKFNIKFI